MTITNALQNILKESNCKPNKIWEDKSSEFYTRSMKSLLEKNAIEMYSTQNEGRPVAAKRFIRALKNKIYKYTTFISENVYIDQLDEIVHKYNNKYHRKIKMKSVYVKSSMYIDFNKENNKENHKTSKNKNIFAKSYVPNWFEDVVVIKKVKKKKLLKRFTKKSCKK